MYCFSALHTQNGSSLQTNDRPSESIFRIWTTKRNNRHSNFLERFWERHRQNISLYSRLNASRQNSCSESIDRSELVLPNEIQLQCLDPNSLRLLHERNILRPGSTVGDTVSLIGSSLDLEWEHEYNGQNRSQQEMSWLMFQDDCSTDSEDNISMSDLSKNQPTNAMIKHLKHSRNQPNNQNDQLSKGNRSKNSSWSHISTPDSLEWDVHEDDRKFKSEEDLLDQETIDLLQEIERLKNRALNETGDGVSPSCEQES